MESCAFKTEPEAPTVAADLETNFEASEPAGDVTVTPPVFIYTQSEELHSHWLSVLRLRLQEVLLESSVRSRTVAFFFSFFACAAALGCASLHSVAVYTPLHMFMSLFFFFPERSFEA